MKKANRIFLKNFYYFFLFIFNIMQSFHSIYKILTKKKKGRTHRNRKVMLFLLIKYFMHFINEKNNFLNNYSKKSYTKVNLINIECFTSNNLTILF